MKDTVLSLAKHTSPHFVRAGIMTTALLALPEDFGHCEPGKPYNDFPKMFFFGCLAFSFIMNQASPAIRKRITQYPSEADVCHILGRILCAVSSIVFLQMTLKDNEALPTTLNVLQPAAAFPLIEAAIYIVQKNLGNLNPYKSGAWPAAETTNPLLHLIQCTILSLHSMVLLLCGISPVLELTFGLWYDGTHKAPYEHEEAVILIVLALFILPGLLAPSTDRTTMLCHQVSEFLHTIFFTLMPLLSFALCANPRLGETEHFLEPGPLTLNIALNLFALFVAGGSVLAHNYRPTPTENPKNAARRYDIFNPLFNPALVPTVLHQQPTL